MSTKVNFTLVGVFLFTFCLAIIGFVFWLGKYGNKTAHMDMYKIYLHESVAGLNIQSSIKYKGLDVGAVKDIRINPNNSEQIEVLIEIIGGTPIKVDTLAVLEAQGITGLKFINLEGGLKESKLLKSSDEVIPIIQSKKSFFGSIGDTAQDISLKVNEVLNRINYLLSEKNLDNFSNLIENTSQATSNIDKRINSTLNQLESTLNNIQRLIDEDARVSIRNIGEASGAAKVTFEQLSNDLASGNFDIKQISQKSLRRFDQLMIDFDRTINNANKVLEKYSESPSDILFKSRSDKFGPGERNE